MKSFDYHSDESKITPTKFIIGLTLVLGTLIAFNFQHQTTYLALALALALAHLLFWFARSIFRLFVDFWLGVTDKIQAIVTPTLLAICYFSLIAPYGILTKIFIKTKKSGWHDSQYPLDYNEPF